jgi:RNA polymerase sigma-70 factor (ECF subfamily)
VRDLRDGSEYAFECLFEKYKGDIFLYTSSLIKSRKLAEEVTQDVFLKVWLKRKTLEPEKSFKALIFTIAKNRVYDLLVKAARDLELKQLVFSQREYTHNPTEDYLKTKEYESLKKNAIKTLSPKKRKIYNMSRNEGKSYKEIADELGIAQQTVKNQMSKSLQIISTYLKSKGGIVFMLVQGTSFL